MKSFTEPSFEMIQFENFDIFTASSCPPDSACTTNMCPKDDPWG